MSQAGGQTIENHFNAGLVTDTTPLTFPENAVVEGTNCLFHLRGFVERRLGLDFEKGYATKDIDRTDKVVTSFVWMNAGGQPFNFAVVQVGLALYIYAITSGAVSANYKTSIDLSSYSSGLAVTSIPSAECEYAFGNGYLFVAHPYLETIYVAYDAIADTFSTTVVSPQIRDFSGIVENVALDNNPTTLTNQHKYNLKNQGWDDSKITSYHTQWNYYPANSEIWWIYRDASDNFTPSLASSKGTGLSQAPKGHYLYNPYYQDRSAVSGVATLPVVSCGFSRPSTVAFFAGRLFLSGVLGADYTDKIYFSQVLSEVKQVGNWFQAEDPTSPDFFDLLSSDGGVISIPDCGQVVKLFVLGKTLLVFATNGVWSITGSQGLGFAATDYSINKVGNIPALSPSSFVDAQGVPMWWNQDGIYTIAPQSNQPESLTDYKIKYFYDAIPLNSKKRAKGAYNHITRVVQWFYRSTDDSSVTNQYSFDKCLNFNVLTNAFYTWDVDASVASVNGLFLVREHTPTAYSVTASSGVVQAVDVIPAATEWGYAPYQVYRDVLTQGIEYIQTENGFSVDMPAQVNLDYNDAVREGLIGSSKCDWKSSIDTLEEELPSVGRVNLFVTWYGDDLNCGSCDIYPAVVQKGSGNMPADWAVAGYTRDTAPLVTWQGGTAVYGGTPSDDSVIAAISDLNTRGLAVTFTPFLLLDIPSTNSNINPYTGTAPQPSFPWRGRITCSYGTDKSASASTQIAAFVAQYRTFVLHYANLCASAGGVDTFVLGTELRGLTWVRDGSSGHPFVSALVTLAADVKAILPSAKLTYSADWSEWFGHQPSDGSGDVYFHLDPLWASSNIAAIGIDNYWPLSDFRDGNTHLDWQAGWRSVYDVGYLQSNIKGGEGYDWYYANQADRDAQIRTAITDGAYSKPWVFRYKDIWNWWSNRHYNRPLGVESGTYTSWIPQSKPIWFMEMGCPSVHRGSNQPNVFHDPKSSESAFPYYSNGKRDDRMQRQYLHALLDYFDSNAPTFTASNNPTSSVYSGPMVDPQRIYVYCWDARPYPWFPYGTVTRYTSTPPWNNTGVIWGDATNYETGHWINGRASVSVLDLYSMLTTYVLSSMFKYIVTYPKSGGGYKLTFADEHNLSYLDWETLDGVGKDYSSYFVSGYRVHGDAIKKYQNVYLRVYIEGQAIPAQFQMCSKWDSARMASSHRWSTPQMLDFSTSSDQAFPSRRIITRGRGFMMNFMINSISGKPFRVIGWSTEEVGQKVG